VLKDNTAQAGFDTGFVRDNKTEVTLRVYFGTGRILTLSIGLNQMWNPSSTAMNQHQLDTLSFVCFIKSQCIYMFRALLARLQEAVQKCYLV
jgi:hypothetical protein